MTWKRVVIIGAGGHAREVAEIFRHCAHESGGAVVTRDLPVYVTAVGLPVRVIKTGSIPVSG